jgi:choline dehydrogenase
VIGGSSSINGMVYVRGHAGDFDHWAERAPGWGYADVLPYFKRMELARWRPWRRPGWRGSDGPLHVTRGAHGQPAVTHAFVEAGAQAGYG